jgi:hypothetical protein
MNLDDYLTSEPEYTNLCIHCEVNEAKRNGYCSEECFKADMR